MRRLRLLLGLALALAACSPQGPPTPAPVPSATTDGPRGEPALNATEAPLLPTDAQALPDVDPERFEALLSQLRGTPVLVNVWGSWCGPCTREAPALRAASEKYGDRVQFLGIDILDDRPSAREFMSRYGWRYPSLFDVRGAVRDALGYIGQPITLIYDERGDLSFEWQGEVSGERLDAELQKVL